MRSSFFIAPQNRLLTICAVSICFTLVGSPVLAHHPFGGNTPSTLFEGFLSGLGHPVIGLDHLVFVIAVGLIAAVTKYSLIVPISFVMTSLVGTGIHLLSLDLPAPEFFISLSVLAFGILLAIKSKPNSLVVIGLAAIAGLFHGYAYGEAIVGAEMKPLIAYLLGFASIQMIIAFGTFLAVKRLFSQGDRNFLKLRFLGFIIAGIGAVFMSRVVIG